MEIINVYHEQKNNSTSVPNSFISHYMVHANGDYVKIFLHLLYCLSQPGCDCTIPQIADHFDLTESDVMRALKYWERSHLLRLEYTADGSLSGICLRSEALNSEEQTPPAPHGQTTSGSVTNAFIQASVPKPVVYSPEELSRFCEQEDVAEMVFVAERYIGRSLSASDLNVIFSWYDQMHFSAELIEFLIETCVSKGHTSVRYMEKIAEDLAANQVQTVEQARRLFDRSSEAYRTVMKSFGVRGRNLIPSEVDYINRWNRQMNFSSEMIAEACRRTIQAIHEPSFEYADRILSNWESRQLRTLADVEKADAEYRSRRQKKDAAAPRESAKIKSTHFSNFKQRENDYDDLQKQLLKN